MKASGQIIANSKEAKLISIFDEVYQLKRRHFLLLFSSDIEQPTFLPVSDELSLSIIVSAEALNSAGSTTLTATFRAGWSPSTLLMNRIKRDGWCRDVIFSLMENFSQTRLLYHASTLGKPMTNEHHGDCDFMEYKRNVYDERNYSVQHVSGCLGCEFKGPSVDKVIEILRCGGIPVVARQMAGGELQVEVCKCDLNDYLALSHVCKFTGEFPQLLELI